MTLLTDIEQNLKEARLARDDARRDALALLLSSLRSAEKDLQRALPDEEQRAGGEHSRDAQQFVALGRAKEVRPEFDRAGKLVLAYKRCGRRGSGTFRHQHLDGQGG